MIRVSLTGVLLIFAHLAVAQSVYRWVDPEGTVHYTDRPPSAVPAERLGLNYRRTDPAAVAARNASTEEDPVSEPAPEAEPEPQAAEPPPLTREQKQERCQEAKDRASRYATAHRLYREGEDGQREYLSDQELDAERSKAAQSAVEACD